MLSIKAICKSENNEEVTIIGFEVQGYCICMTKSGTIFHTKHEDLTIVDKEYMESCVKETIDFKIADFLEKASARLDRIQSKQLTSIILELQEYRSKIEHGTLIELNRRIEPKSFQCHADTLENCPKVKQTVKDTALVAINRFINQLHIDGVLRDDGDSDNELRKVKAFVLKRYYGMEVE